MPIFIEGFLMLIMILAFCIGFSILIKLGLCFVDYKIKSHNAPPPPPPQVYYIKETPAPKRKTKKPRKSPSVALKGIILSPEQVKIIKEQEDL